MPRARYGGKRPKNTKYIDKSEVVEEEEKDSEGMNSSNSVTSSVSSPTKTFPNGSPKSAKEVSIYDFYGLHKGFVIRRLSCIKVDGVIVYVNKEE